MSSSSETPDPTYTVFIRLPFPRGDFIDPPPVDWDSSKDKQLWKILSKASKSSDLNWDALADRFNVTVPFVLQQAAWLYERQLSQVRAQMRKVGAVKGSASPASGADSTGGETMRRTGSGGGGQSSVPRVPSSLSIRKDSIPPPSRPNAPSRNSSQGTTVQLPSQNYAQTSPRLTKATLYRRPISPPPKVPFSTQRSPSPEVSSSSESSSDSELPAKSRILRRPPRFNESNMGRSEDADDDDDTPAFLPYSTTEHDPSATLRLNEQSNRRSMGKKVDTQQSQTSDSSASSAAPIVPQRDLGKRPMGPLSPRRTTELSGRGKAGRDNSDGSPSMGSSFSDLDDASVTQSALEEALASKMQAGGMASRMSTISQALKSRYL